MSQRGVAVLPVHGLLTHRSYEVANASGGGMVATEDLAAAFRQASANPQVGTIVLDVDSPGGHVQGVQEFADVIAAETKPVVAVVNSMAASGAYWIASQADEIVVTPSGEVGAIGVYRIHEDISEMLAKDGVKPTIISAGKFKVEGNPFQPLSDEARAAMQARVDEMYSNFTKAVARGRGATPSAVRSGFGQGHVVGAKEAVESGMADRVATLEETVERLAGGGRVKKRGAAAAMQVVPKSFGSTGGEWVVLHTVNPDAVIVATDPTPAAPEAGTDPPVSDVELRERELEML